MTHVRWILGRMPPQPKEQNASRWTKNLISLGKNARKEKGKGERRESTAHSIIRQPTVRAPFLDAGLLRIVVRERVRAVEGGEGSGEGGCGAQRCDTITRKVHFGLTVNRGIGEINIKK